MLEDKAIVITGAGGGLGRAYALACGSAGARVVVNDVDLQAAHAVSDELTKAGAQAIAVGGSVSSWDDSKKLIDECVRWFGHVDGLVANAAIKHEAKPWEETESSLRAIAEVNILGVQFTAAHAMREMVASGRGGSIVTIVSGAQFGIRGMSAYGTSKGAVTAMTANWASEGAAEGIRVNALSPLALTPMSLADTRDDVPELPDPARVAPVVVALLSDSTIGVTGRTIRFDGRLMTPYRSAALADTAAESDDWNAQGIAEALFEWFATKPLSGLRG